MVEALGKFEVFTFLSNANAGNYSHYMYQLRDAVGFEVTLYVSVGNARETKLEAVKQKQVDTQNLRKLLDETKGTYTLNGFEYVYNDSTSYTEFESLEAAYQGGLLIYGIRIN